MKRFILENREGGIAQNRDGIYNVNATPFIDNTQFSGGFNQSYILPKTPKKKPIVSNKTGGIKKIPDIGGFDIINPQNPDFVSYKPFDIIIPKKPIVAKKPLVFENVFNPPKLGVEKLGVKTPIMKSTVFESDNTIGVSGRVFDSLGNPLPGASISEVNNTSNGTTSDFDGNFFLNVSEKGSVEFRFMGFTPKIIKAKNVSSKVILQEAVESLDEIVIRATPKKTQAKKDYTLPILIGTSVVIIGGLALAKKAKKNKKTKPKSKTAMNGVLDVNI